MSARYQYGNLTIRKREKGPDAWQFRWTEKGKPKSMLVGTKETLPTEADAERAVEHLRIRINSQNPQRQFHFVTVGALIDRFMLEYATKRCRKLTQSSYRSLFNTHIRPTWGKIQLQDVRTMSVEEWLDDYNEYSATKEAEGKPVTTQRAVSAAVKSHVRNLMHTLFNAAIRWEMIERNPIDLVRRSRKRLKKPRVLTPAEFRSLLEELKEPCKTMVLTAGCLGLRVCELLALQWGDIDFGNLEIRIRRSISEGELNETKTEASESALPLDADLAECLLLHKARVARQGQTDFVFASASGTPPWPDGLLADHLRPAAQKAKIGKIGWHTFRHTYSTLLHSFGAAPVVQKELLRHADIQTTLNVFYTQAISAEKREAASKVVDGLWKA